MLLLRSGAVPGISEAGIVIVMNTGELSLRQMGAPPLKSCDEMFRALL